MIKVFVGNNIDRTAVIVDETRTLRSVLEENHVDYAMHNPSLDGSTLRPGDLDKSFADLGVTTSCYLLTVVKADNSACIKVAGSACVIESEFGLEQIRTLEKYRPNALRLFEGEGSKKEAIFVVGTGRSTGSVSEYGVSFGTQESAAGKATVTFMIPEGTEDVRKFVEEAVGTAILNLNKVEGQFADALEEIGAELEAIRANITVM